MLLNDRVNAFSELGKFLSQFKTTGYEKVNSVLCNEDFFEEMSQKIDTAVHHNGWFTKENILFSLKQWGNALTKENLDNWLSSYSLTKNKAKTIGTIMAGNIPLVGFHDFLSVLISGNKILVKQSSNDNQLLPFLSTYLIAIEPRFKDRISFTFDKLKSFDAIIATGSDNTSRYFEYYFSKVPNVIRKNRNSVAVLTGSETKEELQALGEDIFRYYGLGCRSVSKIMIPKNYKFDLFFEAMYDYHDIMNSAKYANNYDYNKAVYLMSNYKLFENGFLMLKEDESYASPIATLFYEKYESIDLLIKKIEKDKEKIQCIVGNSFLSGCIEFGQTQNPMLSDYADGIDIIEFLTKIN
ncbi:acyl-CoA reductase [Aquimarina muelleri]|uniref:Acyl-CoA reductase n=1 Tax=Aquimarina muelleri TaxID=279356 RepID=A0A918JR42_9FLAO|nr:acyl-CoA reductase [Aquimarina muelleri]MCX2762080.1 acyl-CoA reductase [Aquimarina muelleri]GGX04302.1 acyl-CoA reductase [Aquimarina muelleri]